MQTVYFEDLGVVDYKSAWDYQEKILQENVAVKSAARTINETTSTPNANDPALANTRHHLILCEHTPVYTLGKSGHVENILISEEQRILKGIEYYKTNRGGDITFHGPGQIVGYPILDLEKYYTDIGKYLRNIEEVIILLLNEFGIKGERSAGETGVWIDASVKGRERKICAIGVRCSRWITMHGFAFNVNTDLGYFNNIVPCGITDKKVTSLQQELGYTLPLDEVKEKLKKVFEKVFDCELLTSSPHPAGSGSYSFL